jgi:hypothetical protein
MTCPCSQGYFDQGEQQECLKCHISCLSCVGKADYCTLCRTYAAVNKTLAEMEKRGD